MTTTTISETVSGLRALADFLEVNAAKIEQADGGRIYVSCQDYPSDDKAALTAYASIPGGWDKEAVDTHNLFYLRRMFGPVKFEVVASRDQVCERVPTGAKTTVKKVVSPAVYEEIEEDEFEWRCSPVLARGSQR